MFTTVNFFFWKCTLSSELKLKKFCASFILFFFVSFVPLIPLIVDHFDCQAEHSFRCGITWSAAPLLCNRGRTIGTRQLEQLFL